MRIFLLTAATVASASPLVAFAAAVSPIGVSITTTNIGSYAPIINNVVFPTNTSGPLTSVDVSGGSGDSLYSIQFKSEDTVTPDGGFLFTTSLNAKGNVTTYNVTTVTLTITNNGNSAEHLRFDSQILPGHIASQNLRRNSNMVNQAEYLFNIFLNGSQTPIYKNYGEATNGALNFGDFPVLNGATPYAVSSEFEGAYAADWGATNINLDLGIFAPGVSETLTYSQALYADIRSNCSSFGGSNSLADCSGVSVAFGDPRLHGGIVGANIAGHGQPGSPLIGFQTNPSASYFHVVDFSAPLPPAPPPPVIPNYNPPARVPEPAALALLGMGALALVVRRRR